MINLRILSGLFLLILFIWLPAPAGAAGKEETMNEDQFVFTPRVWFGTLQVSEGQRRVAEAVFVPMYGGTFSYTSKHLPQVTFLATFFRGSGDGRILHETRGLGTRDVTRTDFEFLGRYMLPDSKVYLLLGFRRVSFEGENSNFQFGGGFRETTDVDVNGAEFGFGSFADITRDGRHQVFGNLMGGIASSTIDLKDNTGFTYKHSYTSPVFDINVGYQFWITQAFNVTARYRAFIYSFENTATFAGVTDTYRDIAIFHGPEIGASVVF